jgi:galactokinase
MCQDHDSLVFDMNEKTIEKAVNGYEAIHRCAPEVVVRSPGRVNLIGEHIDYNGGRVLPIAIDHATIVVAGRPAEETRSMIIEALDLGRVNRIEDLRKYESLGHASKDSHLDYILGPLKILLEKGLDPSPLNCTISSDIPIGAGLSSSAALEIGMLVAAREILCCRIDPRSLAEEAMDSEHRFAGTPCGIMDMYACSAAKADHACLIDCTHKTCTHIPLPDSERLRIVIIDTGVRHTLADGAYANRRQACEEAARRLGVTTLSEVESSEFDETVLPEEIRSRARHVINEIERVDSFVAAVKSDDLARAGEILGESHRSLRDDFEVSCPELDFIVDVADSIQNPGIYGSRMTGGGFGGCVISLCHPDAVAQLKAEVVPAFTSRFGTAPAVFETHAARGAEPVL